MYISKKTNPVLRLVLFCCVTVIVACASSQVRSPVKVDKNRPEKQEAPNTTSVSTESVSDKIALESTTTFWGWQGTSGVIEEETVYEDGTIESRFYHLLPNGQDRPIKPELGSYNDQQNFQDRFSSLNKGHVLFQDGKDFTDKKQISLDIAADSDKLVAIRNYVSRETQTDTLLITPGIVKLIWHCPLRKEQMLLWQKEVTLRPYYGENQMEYRDPFLVTAIFSPDRSTLLFELQIENERFFKMISGVQDKISAECLE